MARCHLQRQSLLHCQLLELPYSSSSHGTPSEGHHLAS
jgi:hypothetical protein